ncbi:ExbD/TolR family protein [Lewinella sp. IMCC34191]|uniref:ExbD/TolR family protein n=1 Tax=Lewinella sp. IMCC34191 TaxID=2259172 RepID=UPI000E26FADB|nr:biopolymer transporter ExbD [Lewinella sp. IMCC34191]
MMAFKTTRRDAPVVHAGSMADIAFLLLIFFLVTTTIDEDAGILVKLPEWQPDAIVEQTSQVLTVQLSADDRLMVEDEITSVENLPRLLEEFVLSPKRTPRQAVVSVVHDRSSGYRRYLEVYDALSAGYHRLWEAEARRRYGAGYDHVTDAQRISIRKDLPMIISEAEPTDVRG